MLGAVGRACGGTAGLNEISVEAFAQWRVLRLHLSGGASGSAACHVAASRAPPEGNTLLSAPAVGLPVMLTPWLLFDSGLEAGVGRQGGSNHGNSTWMPR